MTLCSAVCQASDHEFPAHLPLSPRAEVQAVEEARQAEADPAPVVAAPLAARPVAQRADLPVAPPAAQRVAPAPAVTPALHPAVEAHPPAEVILQAVEAAAAVVEAAAAVAILAQAAAAVVLPTPVHHPVAVILPPPVAVQAPVEPLQVARWEVVPARPHRTAVQRQEAPRPEPQVVLHPMTKEEVAVVPPLAPW